MRHALSVLVAALFLGLAAAPGPAQDRPDLTKQFLAGLTGFDEGLAGVQEFKITFSGTPIGAAKLAIEAAPADSGAVYRVTFEARMDMGPASFSGSETALLDAKLAIRSAAVTEEEGGPEGAKVTKTALAREGETWVCTIRSGEETWAFRHPISGANHGGMPSLLCLARKLAGAPSGEYVLRGVDWPDPTDEDGEGPAEPVEADATITVADAAPVKVGSTDLTARVLRAVRPGEDPVVLVVSTEGRILSFKPEGIPVEIVAAELYAPEAPVDVPAGEKTPAGAAAVYLKVLAGLEPVDALDRILDYEAIQKEAAAEDPEVAGVPVELFAKIVKNEFAKRVGAVDADQVEILIPFLAVEESGDTATVAIPGEEGNPFRLRKIAAGWKIVRFPQ